MTGISVTEQQQNIEKAQKCMNPLDYVLDVSKYTNDDIEISFYSKRKNEMDPKVSKNVYQFQLISSLSKLKRISINI